MGNPRSRRSLTLGGTRAAGVAIINGEPLTKGEPGKLGNRLIRRSLLNWGAQILGMEGSCLYDWLTNERVGGTQEAARAVDWLFHYMTETSCPLHHFTEKENRFYMDEWKAHKVITPEGEVVFDRADPSLQFIIYLLVWDGLVEVVCGCTSSLNSKGKRL